MVHLTREYISNACDGDRFSCPITSYTLEAVQNWYLNNQAAAENQIEN